MDLEADLNFLPDDYVAARARSRATRLCGGLLGVVIVGVAGAFGFAEASLQQLKAEHASVTHAFDREASRIRQLDTLQKQQDAVARRAGLAEALIEKTGRAVLVGELKDLLPDSTSLAEVVMTSRVRPVPKPPEQTLAQKQKGINVIAEPTAKRYDVAMRIAGLAYTDVQVAQFISRLSRSRYFDDVNLLVSREFKHDNQVLRRFEVELVVRPEPRPTTDANDSVVSTEALLGR